MMQITLRQLRYFDALARRCHFGRAAEACAISQPALSMQIKELEDTLGTALIERGTRHVRLTRFGEEFVGRAREIIRSVNDLEEVARASKDQLGGRLRIGVIPTMAPYLLPTLLRKLERRYPDLDVHVRETLTGKLIEELDDGQLDVAVMALPVSEPSLTEVALVSENFLLVRPAEDKGKTVPNSQALRDMDLLLLEEGHCFRDQALSFCQMASVRSAEFMDASSLSTLVQLVSAGLGVTLIPEMAVQVETRSAAVSVDHFRPPKPSRTIGMVWRKTNPLAGHLLQLSEVVRDAAVAVVGQADKKVKSPRVSSSP